MASIRMIDSSDLHRWHVADIATVLSRAWNAGVDRIIVTGGSLEESKEVLAIAETDGTFLYRWGPPDKMQGFEESGNPEKHFQALLSLAKEEIQKGMVVVIGECGLDYDRLHFCPADIQKKNFEKQFELAYATKLPMFLHKYICLQLLRISVKLWRVIRNGKFSRLWLGVKTSVTDQTSKIIFHNTCRVFSPMTWIPQQTLLLVTMIPSEPEV